MSYELELRSNQSRLNQIAANPAHEEDAALELVPPRPAVVALVLQRAELLLVLGGHP